MFFLIKQKKMYEKVDQDWQILTNHQLTSAQEYN